MVYRELNVDLLNASFFTNITEKKPLGNVPNCMRVIKRKTYGEIYYNNKIPRLVLETDKCRAARKSNQDWRNFVNFS